MKYLGIDYGLKKVGLSLSEGQIASIFKIIQITGLDDALQKIEKIAQDEEIERVVVGLPEGETGKFTKKFADKLKIRLEAKKIEVIEVDETLSSKDAKDLMIEAGTSKKDRQKEDSYAAALILQNFLDSLE